MKIVKKTECKYELYFDEKEVQQLEDIEDVFEVTPEEVIDRSVSESLRLGIKGIHGMLNVIRKKEE